MAKEETMGKSTTDHVQKVVKEMGVSVEIQLSAYLRALMTNSSYYSNLSNVQKQYKKVSPYVCYEIARQMNSITAALQFV